MTSSETVDVIERRYSCRAFQDTPVPAEILRTVAETGVRAPSAMNRQPWKLIVVSDRAALAQIDQTGMDNLKEIDEAGHSRVQGRGGRLLYNAPAMIIIAIDSTPAPYPASMDAGIVAAHLALAATSLGLDTCIAAMPRMAFRADSADSLAATYLPEGFEFAVSVLIGYAVTSGGAQHEPDFTKITYL